MEAKKVWDVGKFLLYSSAELVKNMNDDGVKKLFDMADVLDAVDLRNLTKHLWKQREFFKKIFNLIRDGLAVINGKGEIFYCNASAREMLGIGSLQRLDTIWKYVPEFIVLSEFWTPSACDDTSFVSKEIRISYPKRGILNVTVARDCGECDGADEMFVLRIVDITEERAVSEKTLNAEKISSVMLLASGVAHEIGNPLNAIALHLRLMQKQFRAIKNADARAQMETSAGACLDEISRLDGIVKNFLQAIRPQNPKMEDVQLADVLRSAIELMAAEFKSLNVAVANNAGQLPIILGDAGHLKQVFFNILKNSCEAIASGGTIVIDGASNDSDAILTFTDNGSGISAETLDKIFQPYFSTKQSGNGLGMVIVERILREHGATIDIASAKNMGTKISINFPRKDKCVPLLNSNGNQP
ncbi:MAG: PAS domain-containing protein [Puniceicoccales bacterium]|jgi:nitrogen fixation/metabolism regulation signal transduction histidine kinase|nr:PAS domain-containing protein [Puniceicoccales bacterium]